MNDTFDFQEALSYIKAGLVVGVTLDGMSRAFKLKCFKFLNKEQEALDKGEENIEDEA